MRLIFAPCSLAVLVVMGMVPHARAQKTEASLIAAWEQAQKSDPSTTKFERVKDRQYHFATRRFPFDGDLLVRNVVIEDFQGGDSGISMGSVEAELQGVSEDFYRTFARSYSQWNRTNSLYWDGAKRQWLTSDHYLDQARQRISMTGTLLPSLMSFGWLGFLVIILGSLLFALRRYNGRMKVISQRSERTLQISERNSQLAERNSQIFEQGMKLREENAKILREILEELKKLSGRS